MAAPHYIPRSLVDLASDIPEDFEPNPELIAARHADEQGMSALKAEFLASILRQVPPSLRPQVEQLARLDAEHRQVCADVLDLEVRTAALDAYDQLAGGTDAQSD